MAKNLNVAGSIQYDRTSVMSISTAYVGNYQPTLTGTKTDCTDKNLTTYTQISAGVGASGGTDVSIIFDYSEIFYCNTFIAKFQVTEASSGGGATGAYSLDYSNDLSTWTQISTAGASNNTVDYLIGVVIPYCRYVRIRLTNGSNIIGGSISCKIFEIRLMGS